MPQTNGTLKVFTSCSKLFPESSLLQTVSNNQNKLCFSLILFKMRSYQSLSCLNVFKWTFTVSLESHIWVSMSLQHSAIRRFEHPAYMSHLNFIPWLAEFFIQWLFCRDIVMKTKSQVTQRQTPDRLLVGSFPWGLLQMDCLSLSLSFILAVSISRSPTLTSLGILLPSLCAQGSIGVVSPLPWGAWNEIGCSTWPPLHHLYARLLLTIWTILYIWEIYIQSNSRLVLLRQQKIYIYFFIIILFFV